MKFKYVEGAGFKSIKETVVFNLDRRPGLYHVTGLNLTNRRLGANGVGKSTIFDLIFWVIYGYTSRNLKAANIHSWNSKEKTYGILAIEDDQGIPLKIKRTWKPNGTFIEQNDSGIWDEVDDLKIQSIVGLNSTAFLNSVFIGQFSTMFFDMRHQDQAALFSNVLNLDAWLERSKEAGRKASGLKVKIDQLERQYSNNEGKREVILRNIAEAEAEYLEARTIALEIADSHKKTLAALQDQKSLCDKMLKDTTDKLYLFGEYLSYAEGMLVEISATRKPVADDYNEALDDLDRLEFKVSEASKAVKQAIRKGTCITCGHSLTDKELSKIKTDSAKTTRILSDKIASIEEEVRILGLELDQYDSMLDDYEKEVKDLKNDRHSIRETIASLNGKLDRLELEIRDTERALSQLDAGGESLLSNINYNHEELLRINNELLKDHERLFNLNREYQRAYYWIKGFKDVRLYVIEQALTDLEIEVNSVLDSLGLEGWKVKFEIERETTAKTIKKGFMVMVYSPGNSKPVPWEAWSGGEATRLRIAGTAGLSNLVSAATGVYPNIEVWDEPSSHMAGEGIEDMLDMLARRALDTGKQIYLVDHHAFSYGGFAEVITVIKDNKGTRVQ